MINLVQAFSVSVKHYLRSEPGIYYEDLYPLISFLPQDVSGSGLDAETEKDHRLPLWHDSRAGTPVPTLRKTNSAPTTANGTEKSKKSKFNPEGVLPQIPSAVPLKPARLPPKATIFDFLPILYIFKPIWKGIKRIFVRNREDDEEERVGSRNFWGKRKHVEPIESNVPLEIILFLSSYLQMLLRNGLLQPAIATAYTNALMALQDSVTNLERIRTTPIPFAYQTHLRMSVWLYLFFLPFEIHAAFKWLTIPATAFAAFLYLGFLEIGQEIENPFNYDANDLDLDHFCLQIERELSEITAHPAPDPASFIFSMWNQPFAPADRRTAEDILKDTDHDYHGKGEGEGIQSVRRTLLKSWREIGEATHHKDRPVLSW
ncbi:hypothetical protein FRC03_007801 [Tulasnella sp. 419]|nr:hypothetical protein FRC03_007801 [Tulasnella sp. 419]